jgi:hypothetical protein
MSFVRTDFAAERDPEWQTMDEAKINRNNERGKRNANELVKGGVNIENFIQCVELVFADRVTSTKHPELLGCRLQRNWKWAVLGGTNDWKGLLKRDDVRRISRRRHRGITTRSSDRSKGRTRGELAWRTRTRRMKFEWVTFKRTRGL